MILVTGGTGRAGSEIVRALVDRGAAVRAFVREREKAERVLPDCVELAIGDFEDFGSVEAALAGAEQLVLSCADDPRRVEWETRAIDAAAARGIGSVVRLSTVGAEPGASVAFWDWHGRVDRHVRASGAPWVVVQSSFYMSNLLAGAEQVAREGRVYAPAAGAEVTMIDPRDVGAAIAAIVTGGRRGRTIVVTGPEAITWGQVAEALSAATCREVQFVDVPDEGARQALIGAGTPEFVADQLVRIFRMLRQGAASEVTGAVEALTGRPPRSFAEFVRDHAGLFEPMPVA